MYDSANQLIRENNQKLGKTWTWTYDNAGNILSKSEYAYTTGELGTPIDTIAYTYGDADWGDLLTGYDGRTVTSDQIGNILSDGTHTYTWENGRQLASMDSWDFEYDTDGLRTRRYDTDTGMEYLYTYRDGLLVKMLVTGEDLEYDVTFTYDQNGTPVGFEYYLTLVEWYSYTDSEGNLKWMDAISEFCEKGFFVTNAQGDVIALVDEYYTQMGEYTYDAWGAVKSVVSYGGYYDHIMNLNPLRYRGYVYDNETGLYYLQSRYYNPEMGRFINADSVVSGVGGEVLGYNMFAYCFNNPVNLDDSSGNWPKWATKLVAAVAVVAVVAVVAAVTVATAGAGTAVAAVAVGAAKGAAIGLVTGAASGAVTGYLTTGTLEGALDGMATGALTGAITGAVTGGIQGGMNYTPNAAPNTASTTAGNTCSSNSILPKNGQLLNSSDALDLAEDFLGPNYSEMSPGRFVSSDGLRQVRMTASDLTPINNHAGAPHLNFETLAPNPLKPGKFSITGNAHIFFYD